MEEANKKPDFGTAAGGPGLRDDESREKPRVQSAERAVRILLEVASSANGLKAKEISDKLQLPRQVGYHLLHTLQGTGVLRKNDQGRYVIGLAAAAIAEAFRQQMAPPEHLAPRVRFVASMSGETAYAGGWVDGEIVTLAAARGHAAVQAAEVPHGYSSDAHARAAGKLLLALADRAILETYLGTHRFSARTPNTITNRTRFAAELEAIRQQGYALDNEEFHEGLCCLAVPFSGMGGRFALGLSAPAQRFNLKFEKYLAVLRSAARLDRDPEKSLREALPEAELHG